MSFCSVISSEQHLDQFGVTQFKLSCGYQKVQETKDVGFEGILKLTSFVNMGHVTRIRFVSLELYWSWVVEFQGLVHVRHCGAITSLTSVIHRCYIGDTIRNGSRRYTFWIRLKCTTAVLRYGFVNVGRAPFVLRKGSAALRWHHCVCNTEVLPMHRQYNGSVTVSLRFRSTLWHWYNNGGA